MKANKLKICFIGGLSNGRIVVDYFERNNYVDLGLIITYPNNTEKPRHTVFPENKKIIKDISANKYLKKIKKYAPDYIFVAGWSELLSNELINIPTKGTIGFHPSKLPFDKGRSVLAWQIEEGYSETALSMFYYNDLPDGGDIIGQEKIKIELNDYINDVLNKVDFATENLLKAYFPLLRKNMAPRIKQELNLGNFRPLRNEKNSIINWNQNSINIYNKIRAISKPYPGAVGIIEGKKYKIWESKIIDFYFGQNLPSGSLIAKLYDNSMIVKTKDGFLLCTKHEEIR